MTIHAWLVQASGLPSGRVWQAYQGHVQTPADNVDYITYHATGSGLPQFLLERITPIDANTVQYSREGETKARITIRFFGPSRASLAFAVRQSRYFVASRVSLRPWVVQKLGTEIPIREPDGASWREYISLDVEMGVVQQSTETGPRIQSSNLTGSIGADDVEVTEP